MEHTSMEHISLASRFPASLPSPAALEDPAPLVQAWASIREVLIEILNGIPDPVFARDAERPGWSAGQNAEHLFKTQKAYSRLIPAALSGRLGLDAAELISLDYADVFRTASEPGRANNPESVTPEGTWNRAESLRRLGDSRSAMEGAFAGKTVQDLRRRGFLHPLVGPVSLLDWCFVLAAHEIAHGKSLARKYVL